MQLIQAARSAIDVCEINSMLPTDAPIDYAASMRDGPIRKADVAASSGGAAFRRPRSGVARDVR